MNKLTAEQRIEKAHVTLMRHKKFCLFSGLFMVGKVSVSDLLPTAATNGVDVAYGRSFVDRLDDKQLGFLILHEAMHKAYRHLTTWEKLWKKDRDLANMSCDYVINLQIRDYDPEGEVVRMPTTETGEVMGCIDERFRGMDASQVFAILEKENPPRPKGSGGEVCDNPNSPSDTNDPNNPSPSRNVQGFDEHLWEEANQANEEELKEIAKEIDNALRQGAMLAGRMNGEVSREILDLLNPKIDWREVLRDFVKQVAKGQDDSSWRRFNRRMIGSDIYLPQAVSQKINCIALGIDTSGSIGGEILTEFLSEVKSICDEVSPNKVELMYWDSAVAGHETYEASDVERLTDSTKPRGGGGTDPNCVVSFMKKKNIQADCVVMLTDGYFFGSEGDWDSVNSPLLWCVKDNKDFTNKFGKAVHI